MTNSTAELAKALDRVIRGDLESLDVIAASEHAEVLNAAEAMKAPLVVPRSAAISVARDLLEGTCSPEVTQSWASFVGAGFVANRSAGPIRTVVIEFEDAWEDAISATVSRLEEIGDLIDGEVTNGEALDLLQLLGEP